MIRLKAWCLVLGLWLARWGGWMPPPPEIRYVEKVTPAPPLPEHVLEIPSAVMGFLERARALMIHENFEPNASGEAKRHRVLARLMKEGASESIAALAIEVCKQRW